MGPVPEEKPTVSDSQKNSETANDEAPVPAAKAVQRVIKKYPNRRLYDTETSTYITLSEVKQFVMASQPLVVRDAKTGEDITRSILLQILLEEEAGGAPMFTEAVLAKEKVNVIDLKTHSLKGSASVSFTAEVPSAARLNKVLAVVAAIPDVRMARRR